ncbi:Uncharacterized protein FWK35_00021355 [Aphis craccivora]|uniref:Integrase catalytic domain-containing protein n=1 Tax=Aphis craccivora TaxID=307492 RepID=A0A6G0Y8F4_APHCR|nr:Uncharacterized protein FWK35_00021355 [Aphis craccivora]
MDMDISNKYNFALMCKNKVKKENNQSSDIKNVVEKCEICKKFSISKIKEPLLQHKIPESFQKKFNRHSREEVVCDNNPCRNREFNNFAKEWKFNVAISPNYLRSNGLTEKAVGIAKKIIKKAKIENKDLFLYFLNYRNAPVAGLPWSPAKMLQSRLQMLKKKFKPNEYTKLQDKFSQQWSKAVVLSKTSLQDI